MGTETCADDTICITNPIVHNHVAWLASTDDGMASWQIVAIHTDTDGVDTVLKIDGTYSLQWPGQAEYQRLLWAIGYVARRWLT